MTPHKHAELIKAWADGAEIEYFSENTKKWYFDSRPGWDRAIQYRIKPKKKWYRVAFFSRQVEGGELAEWAGITAAPDGEKAFEARIDFSRWITDRIYYE